MTSAARLFQLLSDWTRIRILMLLMGRELCVCQIMGVLGISQPLVSRNLFLLRSVGLLEVRREGKLAFYAVKKSLPLFSQKIMAILKNELEEDTTIQGDLKALGDCHEFQKVTGKCDMETFLEFMKRKKRKIPDGAPLRNLRTRLSRGGRK